MAVVPPGHDAVGPLRVGERILVVDGMEVDPGVGSVCAHPLQGLHPLRVDAAVLRTGGIGQVGLEGGSGEDERDDGDRGEGSDLDIIWLVFRRGFRFPGILGFCSLLSLPRRLLPFLTGPGALRCPVASRPKEARDVLPGRFENRPGKDRGEQGDVCREVVLVADVRGGRCQDGRRPDEDEDVGRVHLLAAPPEQGGSTTGREHEAPVERRPGRLVRPGPCLLDGRGDCLLAEEGEEARYEEVVDVRQGDVEHRDGDGREAREGGGEVVLRAPPEVDREPVERERPGDEGGAGDDVPDGVAGEVEAGVRETERRRTDDHHAERHGVHEDQVVARPVLEEIQDELEEGEPRHDEREKDHRRHVEETEEVGDAGECRCYHRHLQGLNVLFGERAVACREQRRDVGEDEDRREEGLCDVVVDEGEEGAVGKAPGDDRDEAGRDETGLPVGESLREQVGDRHHRRAHQRRDPGRHHHDLGARRCADKHTERRYDLDEERSPVDDVAARVERHGVEPGVTGEVRDGLFDLTDVVPGVVAEEVDPVGGHHVGCRNETPYPEREQGEQNDNTNDDIRSILIEIHVSHRTLLATFLFPFEPLIILAYPGEQKKEAFTRLFLSTVQRPSRMPLLSSSSCAPRSPAGSARDFRQAHRPSR